MEVASVALTEAPRQEPMTVQGVATVAAHGRSSAEVVSEVMAELADEPRVLECDLAGVAGGGSATAEQFAPVGRYLQHWPGTVVLLQVPDPVVRSGLASTEYADRLVISPGSAGDAVHDHRLLPRVRRRSMSLSAEPIAPATARAFVAHTMQDWQLASSMAAASQVLSEFVARAVIDGDTDIDVSLSRVDSGIRIAARSGTTETPTRLADSAECPLTGRARVVVQALVDAWGTMPVAPSGRSVWAVLQAAQPAASSAAAQVNQRGQRSRDEPPIAQHRGRPDPDALTELHNRRAGTHRRLDM
jgi:hypothetical protein